MSLRAFQRKSVMRCATVLCLLLSPAVRAPASPADAVRQAWADCQRLPPGTQPLVRYFSLYAVPEKDRKGAADALRFWVNSLSREAEVVPLVRVSDDLYRVNVRDCLWDVRVWERLADVEPYFHYLPLTEAEEWVEEEYGYYLNEVGKPISKNDPTWTPKSKWVKTRSERVRKKAQKKVATPAPWLPLDQWNSLAVATKSNVPVVRGDWWLYQTGQQLGRKAGYYDFLGLGKAEKDFQELVGADVKLAAKVKKEIAAAVAYSDVTLNNRGIERFSSITGCYWRTQDFKTNTFRQNVLRFLDGTTEPPKGDASEQYGTLANGMFAFWLQNAQGERQDEAPASIAGDGRSKTPDHRVQIGLNCVRCHVEGIRPIDDWLRAVYRDTPLAEKDYDKYKRLQQLYLSDLDGRVKEDQTAYARALLKVNGLTPQANAAAVAKLWESYADARLLPADLAREIGVPEEKLLAAVRHQRDKYLLTLDPVLAGVLAKPPRAIRREHWEEAFEVMQRYVGEVK